MRVAYNLLLLVLLPLVLLLGLIVLATTPRARRSLLERFWPLPARNANTTWVHASSVGEVRAVIPLLRMMSDAAMPVIATTFSAAGRDALREAMPNLDSRLAPLDLPGLIDWSVRRARISMLLLVETEIWPNMLWVHRDRGRPVLMVSARMSDASLRWYRRIRPLVASVLSCVTHVMARTEGDRGRFHALGVPLEHTSVGGDLKFDGQAPPLPSPELRSSLGSGPLLVAGSTHLDDEEVLLAAFRGLRDGPIAALRLVVVPRHVDRAPEIVVAARRAGFQAELQSRGASAADVVVVDKVGELPSCYALADLVFVGGTMGPVGGHNLLEPVRAGRVVVHGPRIREQRHQVELLASLGVLRMVQNAGELQATLTALWADPHRDTPARAAQAPLEARRGTSARAFAVLKRLSTQIVAST